jgi:alpha-1,2-mannosyltransferase
MATAAALALGLRLYLLSRPGYLDGITEYDDGVYFGGAIRLLSGVLPYHGYAFVQPPGILLLMTPVALLAKVAGVTSAMGAARLLTAAASAACVALAGALVRHRGRLATAAACGLLALYPDDISTAHTLLLEPWMNLLLLSGTCLAFRAGRLAGPRQLLWAGLLFGLAGAVKYWAAIPAFGLLVVCLWATGASQGRVRRAVRFGGGTLAGFAAATAPFAAPGPGLFLRSTLLDQAARAGSAVPQSLRLASLTGLGALLDGAGRLTVSSSASLFARGAVTATATWATGWLPTLLALAVALALLFGYSGLAHRGVAHRPPGDGRGAVPPLAWYSLGTLAATVAAVLGYSAFFYHYGDYVAPWLALSAGYAAAGLRARLARRPGARASQGRHGPVTAFAAALALVAVFQGWQLSGLRASSVTADAALIAPGACVVADEVSLEIAASRFTAGTGGCPAVLDSLATTLVAGNGVSVQGGAARLPRVVAQWKAIFARAGYVWLSSSNDRRIPWTPALRQWFAREFRPLRPPRGQFSEGQVYVRRG